MEENNEKTEELNEKTIEPEKKNRDDVFSKVVRAGKRTYFFDVKATRRNDYYLTITESKKRFNDDGHYFFEKHKVFLYKEDFEKFTENLKEVVDFIQNADNEMFDVEEITQKTLTDKKQDLSEEKDKESTEQIKKETTEDFINVEFDDLGSKE